MQKIQPHRRTREHRDHHGVAIYVKVSIDWQNRCNLVDSPRTSGGKASGTSNDNKGSNTSGEFHD